jgi:hypothetical protein
MINSTVGSSLMSVMSSDIGPDFFTCDALLPAQSCT